MADGSFKTRWIPTIIGTSISLGGLVFAAGVGQGKADALERRVEVLERRDEQREKDMGELKRGMSLLVCAVVPSECLKQMGGGN